VGMVVVRFFNVFSKKKKKKKKKRKS
jgi:hypothetical protein